MQLRDALELHVLIVNDAIQLLFHGKDQVFEAAEVVAYGKREVGRRNRRHVEACGGGRNPTTAVLPLDFVAFLRRYCAAGWIVPASAIQHLLSQLFLKFLCLMACPCQCHCQKNRNAAAAISVGTAAPARR